MSSLSPLSQTLVIRPRRPVSAGVFAVVVHAGAALAVFACGLAPLHKALPLLLVLASALVSARRWRQAGTHPGDHEYCLGMDGEWFRRGPGNAIEALSVRPPVFVHPWLIVVRLCPRRADSRVEILLLPADAIDAELHRRLRVRLRLAVATAQDRKTA